MDGRYRTVYSLLSQPPSIYRCHGVSPLQMISLLLDEQAKLFVEQTRIDTALSSLHFILKLRIQALLEVGLGPSSPIPT